MQVPGLDPLLQFLGSFEKVEVLIGLNFSALECKTVIHTLTMIERFNCMVVPLRYVLYLKVKLSLDESVCL